MYVYIYICACFSMAVLYIMVPLGVPSSKGQPLLRARLLAAFSLSAVPLSRSFCEAKVVVSVTLWVTHCLPLLWIIGLAGNACLFCGFRACRGYLNPK